MNATAKLYLATTSLLILLIYLVTTFSLFIYLLLNSANPLKLLAATIIAILFGLSYSLVFALLIKAMIKKIDQRFITYWHIFLSIVGCIITYHHLFIIGLDALSMFSLTLFLIAAYLFLYVVIVVPLVYVVYIIWRIIARRLYKKYFHQIAISGMLHLNYSIQSSDKRWSSLDFKRERANDLESIASFFDKYFYPSLSVKDFATNSWLETLGRKIAASFRLYKRSILAPKEGTYADLKEQLLQSFLHVAQGDWAEMEQSEPILLDRSQIFAFLKRFIRALTVGIIPLAVVSLARLFGVTLSGTAYDIFVLLGLIWLVFTIVEVIDPGYASRLNSIKTVRDMLPF